MQTVVTVAIVVLALGYLIFKAYKSRLAAKRGEFSCACCSGKKGCFKTVKSIKPDSIIKSPQTNEVAARKCGR